MMRAGVADLLEVCTKRRVYLALAERTSTPHSPGVVAVRILHVHAADVGAKQFHGADRIAHLS